jgi:hypothetical protein
LTGLGFRESGNEAGEEGDSGDGVGEHNVESDASSDCEK